MKTQRIKFKNRKGVELAALLDLPEFSATENFVLFAHCFTCGKNLKAIQYLSEALCDKGFGVFRFDFTGLGQSEGEFTQAGFTSDISDLIDAAFYLKTNRKAPSIILGHSLGGAAVIHAAKEIEGLKAIAVIGAPYDPEHVTNLFSGDIEKIQSEGKAEVNIGGRSFEISRQFVNDLKQEDSGKILKDLKLPFLILHSPNDKIVGIENARKYFEKAWHPKSFVSLDNSDHLLSTKADAQYAGLVIAAWANRYVEKAEKEDVTVSGNASAINRYKDLETLVGIGDHRIVTDEPERVGGNNFGPAPHELIAAALASCTAMTLNLYAKRKGWVYSSVKVDVTHESKKDENGNKYDLFSRHINVDSGLDFDQKQRLLEIANKCPVHKTLESVSKIDTQINSKY
ncbi:bifunctional alpha/beta hydrolase/OsmC family protein [Luteibaculum oceani]|uniref:Alpha/beta fold hydrolase n=1 Tax=Luteibaculum oceani TaxID=1294296 RepID=A0A5C6V9H1_9FLAO|nr:bifunctional alpha/beta hydrolase/OsmC family protein [Luteibaculum oceani]TXC82133.1 alpha/beta fold hydrolase [Luteibaculum oceani]